MALFGGLSKAVSGYNKPGGDGLAFADKLGALGALLMGDQNAVMQAKQMGMSRHRAAQQEALRAKVMGLFDGQGGPQPPMLSRGPMGPDSGMAPPMPAAPRAPQRTLPTRESAAPILAEAMLGGLPGVGGLAGLLPDGADKAPPFVEGPDGIYERTPQGWKRIQAYPDQGPKVSPGWIANEDGSWSPVKNGPYDPEYIARTTGVRRDAVVSRPMPRAGGSSGGARGVASTGLPGGFVLD